MKKAYLVAGDRPSVVNVAVLLSNVLSVKSASGVPSSPNLTIMFSISLADVVSGIVHVTSKVVSVGVDCTFSTGGGGTFSVKKFRIEINNCLNNGVLNNCLHSKPLELGKF